MSITEMTNYNSTQKVCPVSSYERIHCHLDVNNLLLNNYFKQCCLKWSKTTDLLG